MDYQAQGQTIEKLIIDIANPPSSGLSLFNLYVVLSHGVLQDNICILRDFDEGIFRKGQIMDLVLEDDRLGTLDENTNVKYTQVNKHLIQSCRGQNGESI